MKIKKILFPLLLVSVLMISGYIFASGSENDPLISKSYLDSEISKIKSENSEKIQALQKEISDLKQGKNSNDLITGDNSRKFKAINIKAGKTVIFEEGTEFIVRSGNASVIDPSGNGIPDLTYGTNIPKERNVPLNHYMISPRSDGRGLFIKTEVWIMIKGSYTTK